MGSWGTTGPLLGLLPPPGGATPTPGPPNNHKLSNLYHPLSLPPVIPEIFSKIVFFNVQSESRVKGCCVQERGKTKLGLGRYISSFLGRSWSKVTCFNQSKLKSRSLYFFCGRCFCVSKLSIWGSGYSISKQVQTRIIFGLTSVQVVIWF